jgi:hypothetical protein
MGESKDPPGRPPLVCGVVSVLAPFAGLLLVILLSPLYWNLIAHYRPLQRRRRRA